MVKNLPSSAGDSGSIPMSGRSLEEGMATYSSILAWKIPERGALWDTAYGVTKSWTWHACMHACTPWRSTPCDWLNMYFTSLNLHVFLTFLSLPCNYFLKNIICPMEALTVWILLVTFSQCHSLCSSILCLCVCVCCKLVLKFRGSSSHLKRYQFA